MPRRGIRMRKRYQRRTFGAKARGARNPKQVVAARMRAHVRRLKKR